VLIPSRFFPGAIYYLSAWYNKTELGKRIAALYIAQQFGNAFGGLFAAGVFELDGKHGIRAWQWLCMSTAAHHKRLFGLLTYQQSL